MAIRRAGECALCGQHADVLEEEDVFPTWARNQLQAELAESPVDGQWPPRVKLLACADCNRGRGSEFENPAAPILKPLARGEGQTLDRDQMAIVAGWAWLKDIEYMLGRDTLWTQQEGETTLSDGSRLCWRGELAKLRSTRTPPPGYVLRLAVLGGASDEACQRFLPLGWRQEHARLTSNNGVGLLVIESMVTSEENASRFVESTRDDDRATVVWPRIADSAAVGTRPVPINHFYKWRAEFNFHPGSAWGGGWKIRIPHES